MRKNYLRYYPKNKLLFFKISLGKAYYALGNYKKAITTLKPFLTTNGPEDQRKNALLIIAASSYHLNEISQIDQMEEIFYKEYPSSEEIAKILFLKALSYRRNHNNELAKNCLNTIINNFPNFNEKENITFLLNEILYDLQLWQRKS